MQLTQKIRIFPTEEQEDVLWHLSEKCRLIYNFALAERRESWRSDERITYIKQQNDLPGIKEKYPDYRWVYSKVLQMVLKELHANYKSFFALRRNGYEDVMPPGFKGKKHFMTMSHNQSGFKVEKGRVILTHYYNNVSLEFKIPEKFSFEKVCQVTVYYDGNDFYVSIVYEIKEKKYHDNGLYQAIDLGVTDIVTAVNSHGKFLKVRNPRHDKYWQPKIEAVQSREDHCRKGSRKQKRYHIKLNRMQKKCANQIKDFQHKLSRKIIDNTKANTIIIGNLNVKSMSESKKGDNKRDRSLHRATQNTGYLSRFAGFLAYKAPLVGKRVIKIDEAGTTRMCCICGRMHDMRIWNRTMICECGNVMDRDDNSAVNIMKRFLSQNALVDGLSSFEGILRQTGLSMGRYSQEAPCASEG